MMQFRDLNAQYHALKDEIDAGIQAVIHNHDFILGTEITELEKQLAEYVGVKHCITCANGTDALILALMVWGIGKGDAIFAPDFTFFATINCAMGRGATPVLVDIDEETFNISPEALEKAIQKTIAEGKLVPKLIIPVDLFGQPANYPEIQKIAQKYNLKILEDGAQGFGGAIHGQRACSFADMATTSFFPAKPLGCYGDGGAIFTDDDLIDEELRSLRAQGRSPEDKYDNRNLGLNSRLDTLQAAILLPKFKAFHDYELQAVNDVAIQYTAALKDIVKTPVVPTGYLSSWAQYTICLKDEAERNGLQNYLKEKEIPTMIYYPKGMHQQTAAIKYGCHGGEFPITEKITKTCLALPMHPYLKKEEIEYIVSEIKSYFG